MTPNYQHSLNPQKALIWRIVHRANLPWILENGLHAINAEQLSPHWVHIGNPELIAKRAYHPVTLAPGGVLNDYVPFYFTPFSPMLKNIHSGYAGIVQRANADIVILVSSMHQLHKQAVPFVFTDAHAYYQWANWYSDIKDLERIDWALLQRRDFKRDTNDPAKFERYQAEALVYRHCPISALVGIICHTEAVKVELDKLITERRLQLPVHARPEWYFS